MRQGKIKLNQFSKAELEQRRLNALRGGCGCEEYGCPCMPIFDPTIWQAVGTNYSDLDQYKWEDGIWNY